MKKFLVLLLTLSFVFALSPHCLAASSPSLISGDEVLAELNGKNCVKDTYVTANRISLPYRLYVPDDYDPSVSYPLILYFHGAGDRGADNEAQVKNSVLLQRMLAENEKSAHPCIILAPQCPANSKWVMVSNWTDCIYDRSKISNSPYMAAAEELLEEIAASYSIDEGRLYVTGLSMGGYATWDIITRNPDKFAAAVPVCGGLDPTRIESLKKLPIWTFHNDKDPTVPPDGTRRASEILTLGGNFNYTEYRSSSHNAWTAAYTTQDLITWMFDKVNTVDVNYPTLEHVQISGDRSVHRNERLAFSFTVDEGYAVKTVRVGGVKVNHTNTENGGSVELAHYAGGEITLDVRKIATVSTQALCGGTAGGGSVTVPNNVLVGDTVSVKATPNAGYKLVELTINGVKKTTDENGSYLAKITDENTVIVATFESISATPDSSRPNEGNSSNSSGGSSFPAGGITAPSTPQMLFNPDFSSPQFIIGVTACGVGVLAVLIVFILAKRRR